MFINHEVNALLIFMVTAGSIQPCYIAVATNSKIRSVVHATACVLSLIHFIANRMSSHTLRGLL